MTDATSICRLGDLNQRIRAELRVDGLFQCVAESLKPI
jgi:hypothetical protein